MVGAHEQDARARGPRARRRAARAAGRRTASAAACVALASRAWPAQVVDAVRLVQRRDVEEQEQEPADRARRRRSAARGRPGARSSRVGDDASEGRPVVLGEQARQHLAQRSRAVEEAVTRSAAETQMRGSWSPRPRSAAVEPGTSAGRRGRQVGAVVCAPRRSCMGEQARVVPGREAGVGRKPAKQARGARVTNRCRRGATTSFMSGSLIADDARGGGGRCGSPCS